VPPHSYPSVSDSASLSPTLRALQIKFTYLLTYLKYVPELNGGGGDDDDDDELCSRRFDDDGADSPAAANDGSASNPSHQDDDWRGRR